jgi:DNA-directed RNA polymerase subunit RPC12/RpoP
MECIVCKSKLVEVFEVIDKKKYWKCKNCYAKFLDKSHYLDHKQEKKRYLEHNNKIDNVPYRNFLSKLFIPLEKKLSKNDYGLEFGCGHGPALAHMDIKLTCMIQFFFQTKKS